VLWDLTRYNHECTSLLTEPEYRSYDVCSSDSEVEEDAISHDPLQDGNAGTDLSLQHERAEDDESEDDSVENEGEESTMSIDKTESA